MSELVTGDNLSVSDCIKIIESKRLSRVEKQQLLYTLFKNPDNFEVFCRFIFPHYFTNSFTKMHYSIARTFLKSSSDAIAAPRGHGKKIANSVPVITINGWKNHGSLKVGDYVFSPNGNPVRIIGRSLASECEFLVYTRDGDCIRAHGEHEWTVWDRNLKREVTIETKDMLGDWSDDGKRSRFLLPLREPLEFNYQNLPLDPYYLGLWLGDGSSRDTGITHHKDDIESINAVPYTMSTCQVHKITGVIKTNFTGQNILQTIRKLRLYRNKHIPSIYQYSAKKQRLELLAGLIDSDGYVEPLRGRVRFVNINKILIDDVCELVRGLGMRPIVTQQLPSIHDNIKGKNICYTVQFNPIESIPTKIKRKKIVRLPNRPRLGITKVVYEPNGENGSCIQVDSVDGLYLVGKNLIPTHNSTLIGLGYIAYCIAYQTDPYIIYTSQNHEKSTQFVEPLKEELVHNALFKFIYGDFNINKVSDESSGKNREDCFDVRGCRIQALSFETNIRGLKYMNMRPSLIVLDDIEDDERVLNPDLRAKDANKLNKSIIPALSPDGRYKFIGTILHVNSLLMRKIQLLGGSIFRAFDFLPDGKTINPDSLIFPERFGVDFYNKQIHDMGFTAVMSEYLNNPVNDEASIIKREWVRACFDESFSFSDREDYDFKVNGGDFAFSDRVTADKSAFVGLGKKDDKYDIFMCITKKGLSVLQQMDYLEYLQGVEGFDDNALEENSIRSISADMRSNYSFPFTLFWTGSRDVVKNTDVPSDSINRHTIGKMAMIDRLATQFQNQRIRIPYKTEHDKELAHMIMDECCTYARANGKLVESGVHGDIPIALGLALERSEMEVFDLEFVSLDM